MFFSRQQRVNLALQGGGAHGAFTWGVLDRLLEDETLDIGWISAASAGAVNAVALVSGLASDGRAGARTCLKTVWDAVQKAGVPDLVRLNPFFAGLSRSNALAQMASLFSPYDLNPLGFDPLRKLLEAHIDFAELRGKPGPELLIAATDVATGRPRLFRRREITVEAVLASACLPSLHHAVEIGGRAYWDGGFSANPDIVTLGRESPVADTLLVLLNPLARDGVPTAAREIAAQVSEITFNQPLLRDMQLIETVRQMDARRPARFRRDPDTRLARHRFHIIEAGRYTAPLSPESKGKPEQSLLAYLHGSGRSEAEKWLARHRDDIGRRPSIDLVAHILHRPARMPVPASSRSVPDAAA
ncbi:MAG: patatin-like phospholipase family protein [Hyphomicrobiaceae bacterium]